MKNLSFVGPVIRMLRLERNWSMETLCKGICVVSYLSKIEQGKTIPNRQIIEDLLQKLGVCWRDEPNMCTLRECLYEGIFSLDHSYFRQQIELLEKEWNPKIVGPCYLDFMVIRACYYKQPEWIPRDFLPLMDRRQRCLHAITLGNYFEAYNCFPCPLSAYCVGEEAYLKGNYLQAMEYLQLACDQASREGYAVLTMVCQHYMANCYSNMGNLDAMNRHNQVAIRLARLLGDSDMEQTISYNIAAAYTERGDYEKAYGYFSALEKCTVYDLHKLAICCEKLGKPEEGLAALDKADAMTQPDCLEREMCELVRYRLEHPGYLHDRQYGELLISTFRRIRNEKHYGHVRFHLPWVTQWLTANRQYRQAHELLSDFLNK